MEQWRAETPREKQGEHRYDPAEFGLDAAKLRERFRFYSERFTSHRRAMTTETVMITPMPSREG